MTQTNGDGIARCEICDWPLADSREKGCVPGDCAYRPDDPAEQRRIRERRAAVQKRQYEAKLLDALQRIALLDEADGHELTAEHARKAVAIATETLGKHPSEILLEREQEQPVPNGHDPDGKINFVGIIANYLQITRFPGTHENPFFGVDGKTLRWIANGIVQQLKNYGYVLKSLPVEPQGVALRSLVQELFDYTTPTYAAGKYLNLASYMAESGWWKRAEAALNQSPSASDGAEKE